MNKTVEVLALAFALMRWADAAPSVGLGLFILIANTGAAYALAGGAPIAYFRA